MVSNRSPFRNSRFPEPAMATTAKLNRRRSPRQERSRETVEAILEAAAQVFERHGYAAGTTNRIAERAGVSIGSLYQYFPNKDAIVVELMHRHLDELEQVAWPALRQLAADPPPLRVGLTAIVRGAVALHEHSPGLHRVLFEELPPPPGTRARLRNIFDQASGLIGEYLRACPGVNAPDPALAGRMIFQVVDDVTHGAVIHPREREHASVYARETVTMLERYLRG
jgi:AcrR family transcriptional regulator